MKNFLIIILTLFVYACTQPAKTTSAKSDHSHLLTTGKWRITEVAGKAVNRMVNNQEPFIQFDSIENRITGTAGCNRFGGGFEFSGNNNVKFTAVYSTKMACEDMSVETTLFSLFEKAVRYSIDENKVEFFGDTDESLFVLRNE